MGDNTPQQTVVTTDLRKHPAVRAWSEVRRVPLVPESIEILKDRNDSKVYRLAGVGPEGSNVIAKQCPKENALAERTIYEEILPNLPCVALRYYGLLEEQGAPSCWVFIEDAEGVPYSPDIEEHRIRAAEWLGVMHTSVSEAVAGLGLPDRGPNCYLGYLRSARERIRQNLANPALHQDDQAVLNGILSQCDALEQRCGQLEERCKGIPRTFVHADLHESNLRVRTGPAGITLLPFDWESAGWAVPAIDLALAGLDLRTYWSVVRGAWSGPDMEAFRRIAVVGKIFQLLALIDWEGKSLACPWVHKPMKHMRYYQAEMTQAIQVAEFER